MDSYNVAEAKANLSALLDRASAGEEIEIRRRGRPLAKLVPADVPRQPIDLEALRALRAKMPIYEDPEGLSFVERLRKDDLL